MAHCKTHTNFFDDNCDLCKQEYQDLKGIPSNETLSYNHHDRDKIKNNICVAKEANRNTKTYKAFTEDRAKKLYEQLLLQYLKSSSSEAEAADKARNIIRKQCSIRKIPFWSWI
jgi:hypothetical protein